MDAAQRVWQDSGRQSTTEPKRRGGTPLGLWEDAQAQNGREDQENKAQEDAATQLAQRQQSEIREFVGAMQKLGRNPEKVSLNYSGSTGWDSYTGTIKNQFATGWAIATTASYASRTGSIVVTPEGRIIDTSSQLEPEKGFLGQRKPIAIRYTQFPIEIYGDFDDQNQNHIRHIGLADVQTGITYSFSEVLKTALAAYMRGN